MCIKRFLVFTALSFLWFIQNPMVVQAQDYGFKAGAVISTLNGQVRGSFKPGLQLGAYKKFGATEKLYVQMEALFTQKGAWNWNSSNRNNINLYYFDFAIMFGILVDEKFTINLGFQPSLYLGGNYKYVADDQNQKQSLYGLINVMDYATIFGLEYLYDEDYTFGARFNYSFVPLQSYDTQFADNGELPYSMVLQLYGKVRFGKVMELIKKK